MYVQPSVTDDVNTSAQAMRFKLRRLPRIVPIHPPLESEPLHYDFKIGLVPMRIPAGFFEAVDKSPSRCKPLGIKADCAEQVADSLIARVKAVCDDGAKVVCCSEYCYPSLEHERLAKTFAELSSRLEVFIVAGSCVDRAADRPSHNAALVFAPGCSEPFRQTKHTPGMIGDYEEDIDVIANWPVYVFHTRYGVFCVLICADAGDKNSATNLSVLNHIASVYQPIDFVLVPSYAGDPGETLGDSLETCRESGTAMVYVNDASYGPHCYVYLAEERQTITEVPGGDSQHGALYTYHFALDLARNWRVKKFRATYRQPILR